MCEDGLASLKVSHSYLFFFILFQHLICGGGLTTGRYRPNARYFLFLLKPPLEKRPSFVKRLTQLYESFLLRPPL